MHLHLRFRRIVALVAGLLLTLSIHAQVITKSFRGVPLKTVLEEVEKQTGYSFLFESKEVDVDKPVTASFKNATIQTVLDKVLDGSLRYTINDKLVTISQRPRQGATVAKDGSVTLSGTVISSSDNQPIVGANVYVEGTTLGVTTDIDGNYSLTVPASTRQVTFSFLGYDMKKIAVKDSELFKLVTLVDASNELEDVVVVGFGVQKKESLVGAVQSVKPSELQVSSSNLSTSFAGKIAGVIAVQKTGEPGADGANFWIRGISTFGSGQSPLLILDGVEITSQMLNNIPPETIESFSVLKDATATALYGSRGANGVMIITTKSGRDSEKMTINLRAEVGAAPGHKSEVMLHFTESSLRPVFAENEGYLKALAAAEPVTLLADDAEKPENAMAGVVGGVEIYLPLKGLIDVEKETARLQKELDKLEKEIKRLTGKLSNEGFLKKAPEAVVAKEREKLAGYEEKKQAVEGRIQDLAKL